MPGRTPVERLTVDTTYVLRLTEGIVLLSKLDIIQVKSYREANLMKRSMRNLLLACFLIVLAQVLLFSSSITIAIMPFEGAVGIRTWYLDRNQMITGITEAYTDHMAEALKKDGEFSVVERSRLEQILKEQNLAYTGRVDQYTAVRLGQLLGAKLIILGTISDLTLQEAGRIQVGILQVRAELARVSLSARVVDVETGVILGSIQSTGEHLGAAVDVSRFAGMSFSSSIFRNSVLGKAVDKSIEKLADEFMLHTDSWAGEPKVIGPTGAIVAIVGDRYIVNLGTPHGISLYDRLSVFELVVVAGLTNPVEVPLGTLRVISVSDEASVCESEDGVFNIGNAVRK